MQREQSQRLRLLLMDDNSMVIETMAEALTMLNHEVVTSSNGQEALMHMEAAVRSGQGFHAAILDMHIPCGMGGAEAARRIRQAAPGVKLIASSGSIDLHNEMEGLVDHVLRKPFRIEALNAVLLDLTSGGAS